MTRSGDGFVQLPDGSVRWGRFGAAGVLVRHMGDDGEPWFFLARRSVHTHLGGTWAVPGGALDLGETPLDAALREFAEEVGVTLREYVVADVHHNDCGGGWSYWTHVIDVVHRFDPPENLMWETAEVRWVRAADLSSLELFEPFRATLAWLGV